MSRAPISLSDHFTGSRLLRFAFPSIVMMVFTSIYSVVDGLFVSNLVGSDALAAINLAFPLVMALGCVGFMFGTGGAALVSKVMGEGDSRRANSLFSLIMLACLVSSVVLACVGYALMPGFLQLLNAEGEVAELALLYGRVLMVAMPFFAVQNAFQSFFIAAERPGVGLAVTVAAGLTNMVGDYTLIVWADLGILGAALATGLGQVLAAVVPLLCFAGKKSWRLQFGRPHMDGKALGITCVNGSSEFMTEVAASVVSSLYNYQLMHLVGSDGVAAYGVIMYVNFVFIAIFFGFSMGAGPIISFHYGAQNKVELQGLCKRCFRLIVIGGVLMLGASWATGPFLVDIFVGYDEALSEFTLHGFRIFALSFLICGVNIFGSAFFTALNNGVLSAVISFFRTMVCEVAAVLLLPLVLFVDGVWFSVVVAESFALVLTVVLLVANGKKYGYLKGREDSLAGEDGSSHANNPC